MSPKLSGLKKYPQNTLEGKDLRRCASPQER